MIIGWKMMRDNRKFAPFIELLLLFVVIVLCNEANSIWAAPNSISNNENSPDAANQQCPVIVGQLVNRLRHNYFTLFKRYFDWQLKYKKLNSGGKRANAGEAIKREFARIDAKLFEEEMEKAKMVTANATTNDQASQESVNMADIETNDYLFKALTVLIEQLELKLADGTIDDGQDGQPLAPMDEESEKVAMERIKRIVLKSFGGFVANEVATITRIGLFYSLANFILVPGNPLFFMAPFVQLVVNVQTPLMAAYMQNIQVRTVFSVVDGCNPVTKMVEDWFKSITKNKFQQATR